MELKLENGGSASLIASRRAFTDVDRLADKGNLQATDREIGVQQFKLVPAKGRDSA
jgi:hypothetical protein